MSRIDNAIDLTGGRSAGSSLLIVIGFLLVGFFVGQFIAGFVMVGFALANGMELGQLAENPNILYDMVSMEEGLISQVFYTLFFTFLAPYIYLKNVAQKNFSALSNKSKLNLLPFICVVLGTIAFIPTMSHIVEWNMSWTFPEFMAGFEEWARTTEDQLAATTERFTTFNSFGQFLLGFVVIAIIPGIGEELLFRGVLQNSIQKVSKNKHLAIWVSAFIFSAIHLQVFGLVPRMLLGALFGYVYVWSGNIWYPIIGHIVNNGAGVIIAYMVSMDATDINVDETENIPVIFSIVGLVVFLILMFLFRKHYLNSSQQSE